MLRNYFRIAWRTLLRHPGYSAINLVGLAVGISCCVVIGLYVQDELSYDRFHESADRIYRVVAERGKGDDRQHTANTSYPVAPHMLADFADVEAATRLRRTFQPVVRAGDRQYREERFFLVDSTFFDVFSFPLKRGSPRTALDPPDAVVITQETAQRYFGDADPIGRTLIYQTGNTPVEFTVTGVLFNLPSNSHVHFDFLGRIDHLGGPFDRWEVFVQNYSFVLLPEHADPDALEAQLPAFVERYVAGDLEPGEVFRLKLQPLTDIHLYSNLQSEVEPNGRIAFVYLYAAIALFILLIACVNFVNLTTARAVQRSREVGVRKVVGANFRQLVAQFLGESTLLSLVALGVAVGLVAVALPFFNGMAGRTLRLDLLDGGLLLALAGVVIFVGIVAGAYPAFYLSSFRPSSILKGTTGSGTHDRKVRSGLVIFQFAVSIALLVCTGTVYEQMEYVRSKNLGFEKEQVVVIPIDGRTSDQAETLTRALEEHDGVVRVSASMLVPSTQLWTYSAKRLDRTESITTGFYKVDHAFVSTYGLRLRAGRAFDPALATDSSDSFMVNEEAVRRLGYPSPEAILDQRLDFGDGSRKGRVIGVVEDFNVESLHTPIEPVVFFIENDFNYLSARISGHDVGATLEFMRQRLSAFAPHLPFDYSFVNERFEALHHRDRQLGRVFGVFSAIAILIACLGLLGLAAFTAERRTKEIGVRKVLGASVANVVALLSRQFLGLVGFAFLVAAPVAYVTMNQWLESFAFRVDVPWSLYLIVGLAILAVAWLTVSYHAMRAALTDPVNSLRYE